MSIGLAARPRSASRRSMPSDASIMEIRNDFKELLELFSVRSPQDNKHKVEYLIVINPSRRWGPESKQAPVATGHVWLQRIFPLGRIGYRQLNRVVQGR